MKRLSEIPSAATECCEDPDEIGTRKCMLAFRLEEEGKQPVAIGRALVTIERCEDDDYKPVQVSNWGTLCLSFFEDPDLTDSEVPTRLYVEGTRYGLGPIHAEITHPDGSRTIMRYEPCPVPSDR
jgi:hypothetical protein